jgi:DNA-binding CsgD family transcriptional regulator
MAHDLTEMIYAAAHSGDLWGTVAPKIARWLGTPTILCWTGPRHGRISEPSQVSMAAGPHVDRLIELTRCVETDAVLLPSPPDLLLSSLSLERGDPGIGEWLHIVGTVEGVRQACHVVAARSPAELPFTEADAERFCSLSRHLIRASSLGIARTESKSELRWEEAIDRMSVGVLIVTDDGRFVGANAEGRRLLTSARQIGLTNGKVRPCQSEKAVEFQELVTKLARGELDRAAMLIGSLEDGGSDLLLGLVGAPADHAAESRSACSHVFAYVSELDKDYGRLEGLLRQAFQLTKMESKTTIAFLRGMGVDEAARSLGLGPATVRTHVKHIYSKTGVQRQSQLVHRTLGTALTLLA